VLPACSHNLVVLRLLEAAGEFAEVGIQPFEFFVGRALLLLQIEHLLLVSVYSGLGVGEVEFGLGQRGALSVRLRSRLRHATHGLEPFVQGVHQARNVGEVVERNLVGFEVGEVTGEGVVDAGNRSAQGVGPLLKVFEILSGGAEAETLRLAVNKKTDERGAGIDDGLHGSQGVGFIANIPQGYGAVAWVAKSARRRKSHSSTTRKYRCLLQRRGAGGGVGFSCDIRSYRIACRIKFWPACLLLGHSLDRLPSVAMLEQSQDPSKRRSPGNTSCQDPIAQRGHPPQPLFYTTSLLP